ncbi:bifunctional phosphatidyl-N-methylethanolamine N-methyltransferase/phosphatidyl-N-dimethylethanolamine N-methyltransferase [Saccharomycopsis crataegensis]|uniref:Phosphatidyl-N-methylethanolamine N-methyltransferase n=1 Tax=Saccharomycopsis crataegensis TaxID=43959 RepID=A0AAV5QER0_9ASCO|nr:bifunctional phosphatidyl-N-methylethanolamine N-methyltransferase/phosphatidyl-N-dimethylethanolamine N-methyltransferase [Saccharomycopsis crataegensis]
MDFPQLQAKIVHVNNVFHNLAADVDLNDPSYIFSLCFIAFNPIFWNIVARAEYNTHFLTKLFGSARRGCYFLAFTIFSLGIARDFVYERALAAQPTSQLLLSYPLLTNYVSVALFAYGNILVLSSMYALGVTGTYLGDYFGILMDHRVSGFPFNISDNPMYQGSTLCFLGTGLWYGKPAGIFASLLVHYMYNIALWFEEPFTGKIYAEKAAKDEKEAAKSETEAKNE